jgi:hypothetical protein
MVLHGCHEVKALYYTLEGYFAWQVLHCGLTA